MRPYDNLTIPLAGSNLIEASAGTGKTFAIACLVLRLVIEQDLLPEQVLVVTFTEAATRELRGRVRERLRSCRDFLAASGPGDQFTEGLRSGGNPWWPGEEVARQRLDRALQTFDGAAIATIHGFCARALHEHAFESGSLYDTELLPDPGPLLQELADDFWRTRFFHTEAPLLALVLARKWLPGAMAAFLRPLLTNGQLQVLPSYGPEQVADLEQECRDAFAELVTGWHDQGDMLREILTTHPGLGRAKETYRLDLLPDLCAALEDYLAGGNPYALFAGLEKFSRQFMVDNALKRATPPEHPFFSCCDRLLAAVEQRFVALKGEFLVYARQRFTRLKEERNLRVYDDLLQDLQGALEGPAGGELTRRLRERYRAALMDEFQDTDPVQYRIFHRVFADGGLPLFLIGDPKQAIYSFRGADIFAYLEARAHVPEERRYTMDRNWRSAPELVDGVHALFRQQPRRPFLFEDIVCPDVTAARDERPLHLADRHRAPLQLWFLNRRDTDRQVIGVTAAQERIVRLLAEEIAGLLADGRRGRALLGDRPVVPEDIAVIVRSHRQAGQVQEALRARSIPAVVQSTSSIFASPEATAVHRLAAAVAEPGRESLLRAALATEFFGLTGNDLAVLADREEDWEALPDRFAAYHDLWRQRGFMVFYRTLLSRERVRERVLCLVDGERRLTNLLHCGEVLHRAALAGDLGMESLVAWFGERVAAPPGDEEFQVRLESDEKAVRIVTIHVSKGLEYPIVFCPFSWGGVFAGGDTARCHAGYRQVVDLGSGDFAEHQRAADREALAENIRLLYVALTRARYRCYLVWGRFRTGERSAPAWLLHGSDHGQGDELAALADTFKDLDDDALAGRLAALAAQYPASMALHRDPDPAGGSGVAAVDPLPELRFTPFTGVIDRDWRVASFSSLVSGHGEGTELPDHDQGGGAMIVAEPEAIPAGSMFDFPRGATAGVVLHEFFEQLDFTGADAVARESLAGRVLDRHGFDSCWRQSVADLADRVLTTPLPVADGTLLLAGTGARDRLTELEFFFPLAQVESRQVARILDRWLAGSSPGDPGGLARRLAFGRVHGMVRGFMDLVVRQGGKYYLLDWKSNHLGNRWEDYGQEALAGEMAARLYHFQYLLYTVALDGHLSRRDPAYRYASHFGGCLYLFLRGLNPDRPGNGVYFTLPPEGLIRELAACLGVAGGGR